MKVDLGVDENFDGHCDNCGWFVDEFGQHRARLIFDKEKRVQTSDLLLYDEKVDGFSTDEFINEFYTTYPYNMYKNQTYKFWKLIKRYTNNDPDDPLSRQAINNFLRFGKIMNGANVSELIETSLYINMAISEFILDKPIITFRGMSFFNGDNYINTLEKAYNAIKNGQKIFEIEDSGFVSTSRSREYAKLFLKSKEVDVLCSYISLPGSCAMPLSMEWGTTSKEFEKEVLLQCMQKYYICGIEKYKVNNRIRYNVIFINSKEKINVN